jgi:hypothetical protein
MTEVLRAGYGRSVRHKEAPIKFGGRVDRGRNQWPFIALHGSSAQTQISSDYCDSKLWPGRKMAPWVNGIGEGRASPQSRAFAAGQSKRQVRPEGA